MAGSYPDVPGRRFAYHLDGTYMVRKHAAGHTTDVSSSMAALNNHDQATYLRLDNENSTASGRYLAYVFPELRNIDGYFIRFSTSGGGNFTIQDVEISSDTSDGVGGTWTSVSPTWTAQSAMSPNWRQNITSLSATNVKAIRFRFTWTTTSNSWNNYEVFFYDIHFYGSVVTGQNPNRLRAWHPTLDEEVSGPYFDFGDVAQGTQQTKQFRLKNNSATLTAQDVSLSQDDIPGGGMSLTFSLDGTTFTTPLTIGNLAPGATSGVLYVRRSVGAAEPVQLRASVVKAIAASWA